MCKVFPCCNITVHVPSPHLQLEDGSAEVFGAELQKGNAVDVSGQKLAVRGCRRTKVGSVRSALFTSMVQKRFSCKVRVPQNIS